MTAAAIAAPYDVIDTVEFTTGCPCKEGSAAADVVCLLEEDAWWERFGNRMAKKLFVGIPTRSLEQIVLLK